MDQNTRAYYMNLAREAARRYGVPEDLFISLIEQESGFDPTAQSPKGAYGLTQLMPATAEELGVDPRDVQQNLAGGARYLNQMMTRFPDLNMALAAYNAGPTLVSKLGRVPNYAETQNYIKSVLGRLPDGRPRNMPLEAKMTERKPDMIGGKMGGLFGRLTQRDEATGLNPLENLAASLDPLILPEMRAGADIRKQGAMRAANMRGNRTADMLRKMQGGAPYADMIDQGADPMKVYQMYMEDKRSGVIGGGVSDTQLDNIMKINDKLRSDFDIKAFQEAQQGYQSILYAFQNPTGVSDYALTIAFAKILDPASVVREGEQAAIAKSGGQIESWLSATENFFDGQGSLPAEVREEIMKFATSNYNKYLGRAQSRYNEAANLAQAARLDPQYLYGIDFTPASDVAGTAPENASGIPPMPADATVEGRPMRQDEWNRIWASSSAEDRRHFLRFGTFPEE